MKTLFIVVLLIAWAFILALCKAAADESQNEKQTSEARDAQQGKEDAENAAIK